MTDLEEQQREDWDLISKGWKKWDDFLMRCFSPVGDSILSNSLLNENSVLLDVGTGSGEPGLTAAKKLSEGRVVAIDISKEMVELANEKARKLGLQNYRALVHSSSNLPFDSDTFDAVVSRFGIMFFPNITMGLKEMVRVLKPHRRMCVSVWGPQNKSLKSVMQLLTGELRLPRVASDSPNPFRCSDARFTETLLREAGLRDLYQIEMSTRRIYDSATHYLEYVFDTNPSIYRAFKNADQLTRDEISRKIDDALSSVTNSGGEIAFESIARICHGTK